MKGLFKRNQLIITALAALVAVAGYLSFGENPAMDEGTNNEEASEVEMESLEGEDQNVVVNAENQESINVSEDIPSNDSDIISSPGEVILVNAVGSADYIVEARMDKESLRSEQMEGLLEIVNNADLTSDEKKSAVDKYTVLVTNAEKEQLCETEIRARGFNNTLVSMIDDKVDVIIMSEPLEITEITRIEQIIKDKTGLPADSITITVVEPS